jgi:hypothetical protein
MDLGDHLRSQADFAATNSQDVAVPLAQRVRVRQVDASDRLLGDANELLGGDLHAPTRAAELKDATSRWAAGPEGYGGLRDAATAFDVSNIAARLNKRGVKTAWRDARLAGDIVENSPLDQLLQRLRSANPTASEKDLRSAATLMQKGATNADTKRAVTIEDMLSMKRALDGKISAAWKTGNGSLAKAYGVVRDEITGGLTETVPAFAKVRGTVREPEGPRTRPGRRPAGIRSGGHSRACAPSGEVLTCRVGAIPLRRRIQDAGRAPIDVDQHRCREADHRRERSDEGQATADLWR